MKTPLWLVIAASLVGACRTSVDPDIVEIDGVIGSSTVHTSAEVRVALVWLVYVSDGFVRVAQEITADGIAAPPQPAPFTLRLTEPPPEEALRPFYAVYPSEPVPNVRSAEGTLVVYEDLNGNRSLDLVHAGSTTGSPDRVLGVPKSKEGEIEVGYFDGMIPAGTAADERGPGFHLIQYYAGPNNVSSARRLPISTPIEIDLTGDPGLAKEICDYVASSPGGPCPGL